MKRMTLAGKNAFTGVMFISPWIIGVLLFVAIPLVQSIFFSFLDVKPHDFAIHFDQLNLNKYIYIYKSDPDYMRNFVASLTGLFYQVPAIIVYSLFMAMIINSKFIGRSFVKAVLFLPVIFSSSVVMKIFGEDVLASTLMNEPSSNSSFLSSISVLSVLENSGMSEGLINYFSHLARIVIEVMWKSGMQIIIILAGLQSIPVSLYEASKVEGITAWESFWKITFPMLMPMIIVNVVYSVIDSFTDANNPVMQLIAKKTALMDYSLASAMSWFYFAVILVIVVVVTGFLSYRTFYASE